MKDLWKEEYLSRLEMSLIYQQLKLNCSKKDTEVIALIENAVSYAIQRTKSIIRHMNEFTLHDSDHLFRVLYLMERLLTPANIKHLTVPELMLLILSAFFHDIGMTPNEKEVLIWKKIWDKSPVLKNNSEEESFSKFKRFYDSKPDQKEIVERLFSEKSFSKIDIMKGYLITDFIRQTHGERAREIIEKDWKNKIIFRDTDLTVEFAQICFSHTEDALLLLGLDKDYLCGPNIFANLPLIGVILRLADILDFDAKRTPNILFSHLYVRNPVSIKEWNKHRSIEAWDIQPEFIQFSAKCSHPVIEESINEFCNLIDKELSLCNNLISKINEFNKSKKRNIEIKFPLKVNRDKIETKKDIFNKPLYIYRTTRFNLSKKQVIDLLMGTKLYGNSEVALRELLQNSIDACLLRQAQEKKWNNFYKPEITVKYYTEDNNDILEVLDNGTGMDQDIIDNYYSKIGVSFYTSVDFYNLKAETNADFTPTSRFGIGILSCFMVADTITVDTRRIYGPHKSSEALNITVEGQESIFWISSGKREVPGTTTKLTLRKTGNPWDKMTENEFINSVESVVPNPPFRIIIQTSKQEKFRDQNSFKKITANSLKDYSWDDNENIKTISIKLNKKQTGVVGSALVAILETHSEPVDHIDLSSKDIEIDGVVYNLRRNLTLSSNKIIQESTTITINDESEIKENESTSYIVNSRAKISLHGIEIPTTLFPDSWNIKKNQVKIDWPFPLILVVDICESRDLDLNSSRSQIIISEKWLDFEEELSFQICSGIAKSVKPIYWRKLKNILIKEAKSQQFIKGLKRVRL